MFVFQRQKTHRQTHRKRERETLGIEAKGISYVQHFFLSFLSLVSLTLTGANTKCQGANVQVPLGGEEKTGESRRNEKNFSLCVDAKKVNGKENQEKKKEREAILKQSPVENSLMHIQMFATVHHDRQASQLENIEERKKNTVQERERKRKLPLKMQSQQCARNQRQTLELE